MKKAVNRKNEISPELINAVCQRLANNQQVRRTLPDRGRLHIDRQLPFLCVYRQPANFEDAGTARLVKGEASYLIAPGGSKYAKGVSALVREVTKTLSAQFGAFLIVEIWSAPEGGIANDPAVPHVLPTFTIHAPATGLAKSIETLEKRLRRVKVLKHGVRVTVQRDDKCFPPDFKPLLTKADAQEWNCSFIGVAVPPVYRQANSTAEFPLLARSLRQSMSLALRQTYYDFIRSRTTHRPAHYHELGRNAVVKAVWDVDRQLAEVGNQFDYLLQLTPVNSPSAWKQFARDRFERTPEFHYRPLPIDPAALKRELYKIPIERVEDPALQRLFRETQEELELKLTMLRDRDTPRFLYESLQLFGGVQDDLYQLAKELLARLSGPARREKGATLNAEEFARRCNKEFEFYRQQFAGFRAETEVDDDINGLIVSRGKLLINSELSLPPSRVKALLAHEVGTHLLTYFNGRQQPFQQLYSGLAGYEELQEGLAVLSEYLVDGLSQNRMRQLAARVIAVRNLVDGASFVDTFRTLDREYAFAQRAAYNITMRVYRGGGLTKDAVYLRGLVAILKYVQNGGELEPLLVGKRAVEHIPPIKELQHRNVLSPVPVTPRYMQDDSAVERLSCLRGSTGTVLQLISNSTTKNAAARPTT